MGLVREGRWGGKGEKATTEGEEEETAVQLTAGELCVGILWDVGLNHKDADGARAAVGRCGDVVERGLGKHC